MFIYYLFFIQHYTPLHAAAAGGQLSTLKQLLEKGAVVNIVVVTVFAYRYNI